MLSYVKNTSSLIFLTSLQGIICGLLISYIIASTYDLNIQGEYYLATSIVSWFILFDFGISHALLYLRNSEKINDGVGFYLFIYVIISLSYLLFSYFFMADKIGFYAFLFCFLFFCNSMLSIVLHLHRSQGNEEQYWKFRFIEYSIYNVCNLALLSSGFSLKSLAIASATSLVINIYYIFKIKIIRSIGFNFNSWYLYVKPVQFKTAADYISSFVGIKALLPIISPFLSLIDIGRIGLSLTLITVMLTFVLTIHISLVNRFKELDNSLTLVKKLCFLSLITYMTLSVFVIFFIEYIPTEMKGRLVDYDELMILFLNGFIILGLNLYSSYCKVLGKDNAWLFTMIYNLSICLFIYISLYIGEGFFRGLSIGASLCVILGCGLFLLSFRDKNRDNNLKGNS